MLVASIILANFLIHTDVTSADIFAERKVAGNSLQATTLTFSENNTANGLRMPRLFDTTGLKPGGFDVKALRIKNDGLMRFKYQASSRAQGEQGQVCGNLLLEVFVNSQQKYKGKLMELNLTSELERGSHEDWVFFLRLDNRDSRLKNNNCNMEMVFKSYNNAPDETQYGFYAQRIVANSINLGIW